MARERAHRIFIQLADNLARMTGRSSNLLLCPLCLQEYSEDALDSEDPELTEEHIIPEILGGELLTLTCKSCNNTHGTKLDAHLIQMLRVRDAFAGVGDLQLRGRIGIGGNQFAAHFNVGDRAFEMQGGKPALVDKASEDLREGRVDTIDLNFAFEYIANRAYSALFRIAYLAMFRELGYSYILYPAAGVVREIISHPEHPPDTLGDLVAELRNISGEYLGPLQFFKISDLGAVVAVIALSTATKRYYAVPIPNPATDADDVIENLLKAIRYFLAPRSQ